MGWVLTILSIAIALASVESDFKTGNNYTTDIKYFHRTREITPGLTQFLDQFKFPKHVKRFTEDNSISPKNDLMCTLCDTVLGSYMDLIREGTSVEEVHDSIMELCMWLGIASERVCDGAIGMNLGIIVHIVQERPSLTNRQLCGIIFQSSCPSDDIEDFEWSIDIDPNQTHLSGSKDSVVAPSSDDLTVAQITDPHYDPAYQVNSWAACDEPNCCRFDQPIPEGEIVSEVGAGRWGDYRDCDSPLEAVIDAFSQIRRQHPNLDYVYFTGDIVDHAIWATSVQHNQQAVRRINSALSNIFEGIPIFPVLGNHESHPVNLFAPKSVPEKFSTQWLYDFIAQEWSQWLPETALETVRIGGYYTVLVRPGFRIVTINNNECYTYNWWIAYERPESARVQLQWLHDTLLEAQKNGEKVHILGHVPPGSGSCFRVYSREYRRIVERFWDVISAQFAGHTHKDEFNIFYSRLNPSIAMNVLWNGGSTTAYSDVNPNYKIYTMDTDTYQVNSHQTWIYNLTLANLTPNEAPHWFKEYDFQEEYELDSLSPRALHDLMDNFARDQTMLTRYWELKYKMADTTLAKGCGRDCLAGHLCSIVTTEVFNSERCTQLMSIWNGE